MMDAEGDGPERREAKKFDSPGPNGAGAPVQTSASQAVLLAVLREDSQCAEPTFERELWGKGKIISTLGK